MPATPPVRQRLSLDCDWLFHEGDIPKAQVWIDGKLAGEKTDAARKTFTVPFPPGDGERTVNVLGPISRYSAKYNAPVGGDHRFCIGLSQRRLTFIHFI